MYSLNFLPLDSNLTLNSIKEELLFKEQYNASILIADNSAVLSKHINLLRNSLNDDSVTTVKDLNVVLESYLYILLFTSSIVSLDKSVETEHYKKFDLLGLPKDLPTRQWLSDLIYTNQKLWFGPYGSPMYELKAHEYSFKTPSELCNVSFSRFINSLDIPLYYLSNTLDQFKSEEEESDYFFYAQHIKLLEAFDLLEVLKKLNSLEEWLIEVFNTGNRYLVDCFLDNGLYLDNISNLSYKFLHQQLSPLELECLNSLIVNVKREEIEDEELHSKLLTILSLSLPNNWFTTKSIDLVTKLAPPGGYNYLLLQFASVLLNRAYCLTHPDYFPEQQLELDTTNNLQLSRVARLLYYCGYLLKKSNLVHLRMYGNNLASLLFLEALPIVNKEVLI